jgi:Rieske Fe-S protein
MAAVFGVIGVFAFVEAIVRLGEQALPGSLQISTTGGGSQQAPAGYVFVAPLSALGGKSSAYFTHPTHGSSILVDFAGQWRAFSATCTHAGCVVNFTGSAIYCPCHAGYFDPTNGAVQSGPPPSPLPEYGVTIQSGSLYVTQAVIN